MHAKKMTPQVQTCSSATPEMSPAPNRECQTRMSSSSAEDFFRRSRVAQGRASLTQMLCCRYIEQVAVALQGRERAVETIQALLRSCRAKTVSSTAAMHQVGASSRRSHSYIWKILHRPDGIDREVQQQLLSPASTAYSAVGTWQLVQHRA